MNKQTLFLGGALLNIILLTALVYVWWLAPHTTESSLSRPGRLAVNAPRYKIAFMHTFLTRDFEDIVRGFVDTLRNEATFVPDVKIFDANNSRTLMHNSIEEVLENDYDLIAVTGSQGAQMVKEMTRKRGKDIPVVFTGTGDPVKLELVENLEHSGNNLTGVSQLGETWDRNMAAMTSLLLPKVKRVLVPYNPASHGGIIELYANRTKERFEERGMEVTLLPIYEQGDVMKKVSARIKDIDLIVVMPDATMIDSVGAFSKLGEQHGVGVFVAFNMRQISEGATMCYGVQLFDMGVETANVVRRILEDGEKPTNIPTNGLEDAYRLEVNVDTARAHGLLDQMDPTLLFLMEHGEVV